MTSGQDDDPSLDHDDPNDYGEHYGVGEEQPMDLEDYEGDQGEQDFHPEEISIGSNKVKRGGNKRPPSRCWSFMTKFDKELPNGKTMQYARCHGCQKEFKARSEVEGTSRLLYHVEHCVLSEGYSGEDSNQTVLSQDCWGGLVPHKFDQKILDLRCVEWIICSELSFRIVEHPKFHQFVLDLCPRYKVPNRRTIARGVLELFLSQKNELKQLLQRVRVSLTTDTWTSIQNINYMVVTAHFVDDSYILHKRIICFRKIISHKGEELGKGLDSCLHEWGISNVFSITLDNATSNDKLIEYMKRRLQDRDTLVLRGDYMHVRCVCHVLNLIVRDGMKELGGSIDGIRNCVRYIHSSASRLDTFRSYCVGYDLSKTSTIGLDIVTRWNATYKMLDCAYTYRNVFSKMADDCTDFKQYFQEKVGRDSEGSRQVTKREGPPTTEQWSKAFALANFLKKFYSATTDLSATKEPTMHIVLTHILGLQALIDAKLEDSDPTMKKVAEAMKNKFDKYWGSIEKTCPIFFVGLVLDPRFKFDMLDIALSEVNWTNDKKEESKSMVKKHMTLLYESYKDDGTDQCSQSTSSSTNVVDSSIMSFGVSTSTTSSSNANREMLEKLAMRGASSRNQVVNEVDQYLNDACEMANKPNFNVLSWWGNNTTRYPILSMIAKDVLTIPSSSVASESAFSLGGRVVDPFRASLTPKTVEALVCTSDWLKGNDINVLYTDPTDEELDFYHELEEMEDDVLIEVESEELLPQDRTVPAPAPAPPTRRPTPKTPRPPPQPPRPTSSSLPPRPPVSRGNHGNRGNRGNRAPGRCRSNESGNKRGRRA